MAPKVLCVAEKPSIAKSVAQHMSGGQFNTVRNLHLHPQVPAIVTNSLQRQVAGTKYIKNYEFDYSFGPPWGRCTVTMTSVIGHLNTLDFEQQYRKWNSCSPGQLFDAPTISYVVSVRASYN